ncbi:MAG: threonine synthase [Lachnospiraceae bacterium]|nr:threonine synthase [Lachnospiraceae bacterium]
MDLMYKSTRGDEYCTASQAVIKGLASDGGLYVPTEFPVFQKSLEEMSRMDYRELAYNVMSLYLTDYTEEELRYCVNNAYDEKFDTPAIAPLREAGGAYYLELFHGRTLAFKDMALSILPYLMTTAAKKNNITDKIVILTATSGDTGKAALAGFADVPGTGIIVFYPKDGVSRVQELQMVTQKGANTLVAGIHGNFDDAQAGVKKMFSDKDLEKLLAAKGYRFSSANSINVGRLVPQVVYYVHAYTELMRRGVISAGDPVNLCVPTGNFGNILAAYFAKRSGLPVNKLILASNKNKVLTDFFNTGTYDRNREFYVTSSPSMDILVSSNLERLIYLIDGCSSELTADLMAKLSKAGKYEITQEMMEQLVDFYAGFATEEDTLAEIGKLYEETGYVTDTHTAVAGSVYRSYKAGTGDTTPTVITSTASPYKFSAAVVGAIEGDISGKSDDELIARLSALSGTEIPDAVASLSSAPVLHKTVCKIAEMEKVVLDFLK